MSSEVCSAEEWKVSDGMGLCVASAQLAAAVNNEEL